MTIEPENNFLDTNILVYAYDETAGERHLIAKKILQECMEGKITLFISNQILGETIHVFRNKFPQISSIDIEELIEEIMGIPSWQKVNYTDKTIQRALSNLGENNDFWDAVIAQTMKENGITHIYTENTKDFEKIKGIKAINPFKK
jgi:predicted nucleic acid-binding protein